MVVQHLLAIVISIVPKVYFFIDADDLWTQDKLELQLAALQQHPEAGVAYSWTCYMSEYGESFYAGESVRFEGNYAHLLVRNFLANGSNPISKQARVC